jgi:hypothetical protein
MVHCRPANWLLAPALHNSALQVLCPTELVKCRLQAMRESEAIAGRSAGIGGNVGPEDFNMMSPYYGSVERNNLLARSLASISPGERAYHLHHQQSSTNIDNKSDLSVLQIEFAGHPRLSDRAA